MLDFTNEFRVFLDREVVFGLGWYQMVHSHFRTHSEVSDYEVLCIAKPRQVTGKKSEVSMMLYGRPVFCRSGRDTRSATADIPLGGTTTGLEPFSSAWPLASKLPSAPLSAMAIL